MIAAVVVLSIVVLCLLSVPVIVVRDWVHEREQKRAILAWVNRHAEPVNDESVPAQPVKAGRGRVATRPIAEVG